MCNIFNDDDDDECQVECFMSFIFSCFHLFQNVTLSLMIMFLFCFSKMRHFFEKVANKKLYPNVYVSKKRNDTPNDRLTALFLAFHLLALFFSSIPSRFL